MLLLMVLAGIVVVIATVLFIPWLIRVEFDSNIPVQLRFHVVILHLFFLRILFSAEKGIKKRVIYLFNCRIFSHSSDPIEQVSTQPDSFSANSATNDTGFRESNTTTSNDSLQDGLADDSGKVKSDNKESDIKKSLNLEPETSQTESISQEPKPEGEQPESLTSSKKESLEESNADTQNVKKKTESSFYSEFRRFSRLAQLAVEDRYIFVKITRWLKRIFKRILQILRFDAGHIRLGFGFEDPKSTGLCFGYLQSLFYGVAIARHFELVPSFQLRNQWTIKGFVQVRGSLFRLFLPLGVAVLTFPWLSAFLLIYKGRNILKSRREHTERLNV